MPRSILLLLLLLLIGVPLSAQYGLTDFNQTRFDQQQTGMLVLGGWAVANITSGLILMNRNDGSTRYFHMMNAGWNVINLGIAGLGYYSALKGDPSGLDLYGSIEAQYKLQKILLFNAGLDVGYILGGLYLSERSKNAAKNPDRLKGFGRSIILQGMFLFVFDLVNYGIQAGNNVNIQQLLGSIHLTGNSLGIVLTF